MNATQDSVSRRRFIKILAVVATGPATCVSAMVKTRAPKLKLGIDNYAVNAMRWKAERLIDYAVKLKVDSLFITNLDVFESLEESHLKELRRNALDRGLQIQLGTWSVCPSSVSFRDKWGTAEEHLALGIRSAKALGSPVIRVILGSRSDRLTAGGIDTRIDDMVKILKSVRSRAVDAGVKVAVENHAGDMHSLELVRLIEEAGKDYVGANLDSGNAVWTLEDPLVNLENLGPYTLTTSLRDSALWESKNGLTLQWTAMGEGMVDWKKYFARFAQLCPTAPVHIETISGSHREMAINKDQFWKAWPKGKPEGFDRFLAMAKRGTARPPRKQPRDVSRVQADQEYQRAELERSIRYCKSIGLGRTS